MIVKDSTLQNLRTMMRGEFQEAFEDAVKRSDYKAIVSVITSATASNTYGWLGAFPQMRAWVGDRVVKDMREFSYTIHNELFEATLGVARTHIEDDSLGQYKILAQHQGQEVVDFFWRRIAALLKGGFSSLCFDGQNFFDTDHPVYPNADGTGTPVPTSNILGAGSGAGWFVLALDRPLKPFIQQERMAPEFDEIKETTSEAVFMKDQYLYGIRYRGSWGYGLWQQAVASREPLNPANFEAAYDRMLSFKRDGGDPLGSIATHLVVDSTNRAAAEAIITKAALAGGESNSNYNRVKLYVCPYL